MLGVLALDSSLESSPDQDSKLMDLVIGDAGEQSSPGTQEGWEHDTELKRQPLKVLLSLPLPSGQEEVEVEEQWEPRQEAKQKLELEEAEDQPLHVVNKDDVVPPLHPKESPTNQTAQQPAAAAQDSAMPTAMVFSEAALPEQQQVQWPESREHSTAAEAAPKLASMMTLTQA